MTNDIDAMPQPADGRMPEMHEQIDRLNDEAWQMRNSDPVGSAERAARAERMSREGEGYARGLGWSLLSQGHTAMRQGENERAADLFLQAGECFVRCGDRLGEATVLTSTGTLYTSLCDYSRGLQYQHAALEIYRSLEDRAGEAAAINNIGIIHHSLGDYPQALDNYRSALALFRETGNRLYEANALNGIGNVYQSQGEYAPAVEHYRSSVAIHRETGSRIGEAVTIGNLGTALQMLGEYSDALEHLQASLRINREIGNRKGEGMSLGNLAHVHRLLGEYPEALEYFHAGLAIAREIGNRDGEASGLTNIGGIHHLQGEYSQALAYHQASFAIFQEIGDRSGEADALTGIGLALNMLGDHAGALASLEAASAIARMIGSPSILAQTQFAAGSVHARTDNPADALLSLSEALELAVALKERQMELEISELISRQYQKLGDTAGALGYLRRHLELKEELLGEETRQKLDRLQTSWQIEIARREAEIERLRNVELKQALDDLKSAQASLVQSEKMASLGQLTAGIAHEINNPINFVSASVRPLRRDHQQIRAAIDAMLGELPEARAEALWSEHDLEETFTEVEDLLRSIDSGARRTAEIVAGLRSFSRLDEGERKIVDLHEGLDAAVAILSGSMGERIVVEREYGALPPVECYPGEINQVFMNILNNAVRAIDGEGSITIRSTPVDDAVRIEIEDTGVGMTPEVRARIFEPFYTRRDVGDGRGLGLSIAWGIVEKHGGMIEVASTPGEGSILTIVLPIDAGRSM